MKRFAIISVDDTRKTLVRVRDSGVTWASIGDIDEGLQPFWYSEIGASVYAFQLNAVRLIKARSVSEDELEIIKVLGI